jgi:hypothetical protein
MSDFSSWALFWKIREKQYIFNRVMVSFLLTPEKIVYFAIVKTLLHCIKILKGIFHLYYGVQNAERVYLTGAGQHHKRYFHTFSATLRLYTPDTANEVDGRLNTVARGRWRFPMTLQNSEVCIYKLQFTSLFIVFTHVLSEITVCVHF